MAKSIMQRVLYNKHDSGSEMRDSRNERIMQRKCSSVKRVPTKWLEEERQWEV